MEAQHLAVGERTDLVLSARRRLLRQRSLHLQLAARMGFLFGFIHSSSENFAALFERGDPEFYSFHQLGKGLVET
jgi:hypothetical protein